MGLPSYIFLERGSFVRMSSITHSNWERHDRGIEGARGRPHIRPVLSNEAVLCINGINDYLITAHFLSSGPPHTQSFMNVHPTSLLHHGSARCLFDLQLSSQFPLRHQPRFAKWFPLQVISIHELSRNHSHWHQSPQRSSSRQPSSSRLLLSPPAISLPNSTHFAPTERPGYDSSTMPATTLLTSLRNN